MMSKKTFDLHTLKEKFSLPESWTNSIIFILNVLIAIPVFLIAHQNLVTINWPGHLDRIILFLLIIVLIQLVLRLVKTIIVLVIIFYFIALFIGTIFGNYGFTRVFEDYRYMIYAMQDNPNPQDIIISKLLPFPNKSKISKAVDFTNANVRNFAVNATTKHFGTQQQKGKNRIMIQCFAVFKEINSRWNYVNDPKGREYIAYASESVQHFSGDCDDHAILMAACIKAIGGTPRIIHTGGHLYPELLIGNSSDLETALYFIKEVLFIKESEYEQIHYHIDERGQIWLNLDYTATYPGGEFMREEILGALTF
ncbi:transglutaminase [Flavobacterium sp.]|jgi:hypothetical protein|uniref:transglutaminase n=1 Tax=Flavobacterium sp. TaxID=239 RepID=UPI0037BEF888